MLNEFQKRALISAFRDDLSAEIFESKNLSPFSVQTITLNLGTARAQSDPLNIGFAFKAIALKNATGGSATVYARFNTQDSGISWVRLDNNDSINCDRMFSGVDLYWAAQSGKTMDVLLFTNAEFSSGSLINSGTVAVAPATTIATTRPTLSAATAGSLIASSTTRQKVTIQNLGTDALYLAENSSVAVSGANVGFQLNVGQSVEYFNRAQIYGISTLAKTAGQIVVVVET